MDVGAIINTQKEYFNRGITKDINFRRHSLEKLLESIHENEPAIYASLEEDLGKAMQESYLLEVSRVTESIKYAIKHLETWSRPKKVRTPFYLFPGKSRIVKEPYGVVLIIAPWNYPFLLAMEPLVAAIAAGNCAIVKTSKNSPSTSGIVVDIINSTFERNHVYALEEVVIYDEVLKQDYDHIFFTGSERVGKEIMRAAADNLTPVTLELGGKSPCIIDQSADYELAAKKIIWGKLLNAGQTCVAPDYCVVHSSIKERFIEALRSNIKSQVGDPFNNDDYPHIINLHHYMRLKNLIDKEEDVIGGRGDDKRLIIEPTIFPDATFNSLVMRNEIFGPLLPIITYDETEELVSKLRSKSKPLACYIFSERPEFANYIIEKLQFGGCCVNDVALHLANEALPFGGVGNSGMGRYHGKAGFDTFTYEKSILALPGTYDNSLRYTPYNEHNMELLRKIFK